MIQFRLFGIPTTIQPFFWVILVLFGWMWSGQYGNDPLAIALFVLAGFISILVHELGHALLFKKFKRQVEIILHNFGGVAISMGPPLTRPQSFITTAAGPLFQVILGLLSLAVWKIAPLPTDASKFFFEALAVVSIAWAVLNLIPVLPLDGGQLLNAILGPKRIKLTYIVGIVISALGAVYFLLQGGMILMPPLLGMFAYQNFQQMQQLSK